MSISKLMNMDADNISNSVMNVTDIVIQCYCLYHIDMYVLLLDLFFTLFLECERKSLYRFFIGILPYIGNTLEF